jgi:hypothetical protein
MARRSAIVKRMMIVIKKANAIPEKSYFIMQKILSNVIFLTVDSKAKNVNTEKMTFI